MYCETGLQKVIVLFKPIIVPVVHSDAYFKGWGI